MTVLKFQKKKVWDRVTVSQPVSQTGQGKAPDGQTAMTRLGLGSCEALYPRRRRRRRHGTNLRVEREREREAKSEEANFANSAETDGTGLVLRYSVTRTA